VSFNIRNFGFIVGGETIPVGYTIQGGTGPESSKAQFAGAEPEEYRMSIVNTDHTVELVDGRYTHYFWARNESEWPGGFALSGGGLF